MWAFTGDSIDIEKPVWEYVSPMWHMKDRRDGIQRQEAELSPSCATASSQIRGQARLEQWRETKQERSGPRIFGESDEVNNTRINL